MRSRFLTAMGSTCRVILALFCLGGGYASAQPARYVVLVTIDGFRPDFYRDPSWGAVNLQQLAAGGVSADGVAPVFPSLTFPNHTTILTGLPSAGHGIFHNAPFSADGTEEWHWYEKDITAPTLWDAVRHSGRTSASVNWPVSVGAPVDYNIPVVKRKGFTQLAITARFSQPPGLLEEVQQYATGRLDSSSFNTEEDLLVMDENVARIAGYLIRRYKPALTTLRLSCVDHFEHLEGRDGPMVRRAVTGADRAIGTIREALLRAGIADSAALIVTGDHGFVHTHTAFAPNVLLGEAGLLRDGAKGAWKAQFKPAGGAAFLYLKDRRDETTLKKIVALLERLPEVRSGKFRLLDRRGLDAAGSDPGAVLALAAAPGYSFTGTEKAPFARPVNRGTHGYFPDFGDIQTGFVGCGAGLQKGRTVPLLKLTDMAPLVARLLRLTWQERGEAAILQQLTAYN
jgi:predicted AlkP superfamily pyrophosphatase or phosphodiesterase